MMHRIVPLASILLLLPGLMFAQSGGPSPDPIAGTWQGDMAPRGSTQRQPLLITMHRTGSTIGGTVTGPPYPGQIRSGSYDPATGALRFDVHVTSNGATKVFVFEGTVVTGTALGRVSDGSTTGEFKISRVDGSVDAVSPSPAPDEMATMLQRRFEQVSSWVAAAAELVPAERYDYRPVASVRTVGQQIGHIADSYIYYCGVAAGGNPQWTDAIEKGSTDKATMLAALRRAGEICRTAHAQMPDGKAGAALVDNLGHTNLHYGNLVTYLRMLGLEPPSS